MSSASTICVGFVVTHGTFHESSPLSFRIIFLFLRRSEYYRNRYTQSQKEQFLEFVISIVSHRGTTGEMSKEDVIRDMLIHILFLGGSCTHSLLCLRLSPFITSNPLFEPLLASVAIFKQGKFFLGLTHEKREKTQKRYMKKRRVLLSHVFHLLQLRIFGRNLLSMSTCTSL